MFFVRVLADESRVIAKRVGDAITTPKTAQAEDKRVSLTKKRTPAEMHALVRVLNAA